MILGSCTQPRRLHVGHIGLEGFAACPRPGAARCYLLQGSQPAAVACIAYQGAILPEKCQHQQFDDGYQSSTQFGCRR